MFDRRVLIFLLVVVMIFGFVSLEANAGRAQDFQESVTTYTEEQWRHEQVYEDWGPALYYGEPVSVTYSGIANWYFHDLYGGGIYQRHEIRGKAYIYSLTGELIELRGFTVNERLEDRWRDGTVWNGDYYEPIQYYEPSKIDNFYHVWEIRDRFVFIVIGQKNNQEDADHVSSWTCSTIVKGETYEC